MNYQFDTDVATEHGVSEAIMINNLTFWIAKNMANERHFYDGKTWTYNSVAAFSKLFPFWSDKQVRRVIESLIERNVIMTGNYNKNGFDKTRWFAFIDEDKWIGQKVNMDLPKRANGLDQNDRPIPDSKTDSKLSNITSETFIKKFNEIRKSKFKMNATLMSSLNARLKDYSMDDIMHALKCAMGNDYHKSNKFNDLTPEFILRPTKFEKYFNQQLPEEFKEPEPTLALNFNQPAFSHRQPVVGR